MSDVSINPNPNSTQLAQIAIQTARSVETIFGVKPIVAMLSFSTLGSGGDEESVLKVREATKLVRESGVKVVGEIQ